MESITSKKTSALQKKILTTLYQKGAFEELISVYELNSERINVDEQIENQRIVDERNGRFIRERKDMGLLVRDYRVPSYRLTRAKLACLLFDWQKFNSYAEHIRDARLIVKPKEYSARQVALTNSLKNLETKKLVSFFDSLLYKLIALGHTHAKYIYLTTQGIEKAKNILTIKSK